MAVGVRISSRSKSQQGSFALREMYVSSGSIDTKNSLLSGGFPIEDLARLISLSVHGSWHEVIADDVDNIDQPLQ